MRDAPSPEHPGDSPESLSLAKAQLDDTRPTVTPEPRVEVPPLSHEQTAAHARKIIRQLSDPNPQEEIRIKTADEIDTEVTRRVRNDGELQFATDSVLDQVDLSVRGYIPPQESRGKALQFFAGKKTVHTIHNGIFKSSEHAEGEPIKQEVFIQYHPKGGGARVTRAWFDTTETDITTTVNLGYDQDRLHSISIMPPYEKEPSGLSFSTKPATSKGAISRSLSKTAQMLVLGGAEIKFPPDNTYDVMNFRLRPITGDGLPEKYRYSTVDNAFLINRVWDSSGDTRPEKISAPDFAAALKEICELYIPSSVEPLPDNPLAQ